MTDIDDYATSKDAAQDLCYRLTGSHDRWGDINDLTCDAYHIGLLAGRAECRKKIERLEAEVQQLLEELDTTCSMPTVVRPLIMVESDPNPEDNVILSRTEHLGLVSPDASGCVEGKGFICELTSKVVAAIDEAAADGAELEWIATDGLPWIAQVGANLSGDDVVAFRNKWGFGERTFMVKLDDLPRGIEGDKG